MKLTFTNFRIASKTEGRVMVLADCIELGRRAYAEVSGGGDPIEKAKERFARFKPPQ